MTTAQRGRALPRRLPAVQRQVTAWLRRFGRAVWRAGIRLFETDDLTYASSIAYYALVSLFPLLLFSASLVGQLTADPAQRAAVDDFILQFFPAQVGLVQSQLDSVERASLGFGVAGTVVGVWVSLGIFRAISTAVNRAWDVEHQPSFVRSQLVSFAMLVGAGIVLAGALAWVSIGGIVRSSWFAAMLDAVPALAALAQMPSRYVAMAAVTVVAGLVFSFVPHTAVRFRDVWVGAVVTGLIWQAGLAVFSWYLREVANLSLHGSIATVVTFLFWVYTSAVIFLFGAEFTAAWIREGPPQAPRTI